MCILRVTKETDKEHWRFAVALFHKDIAKSRKWVLTQQEVKLWWLQNLIPQPLAPLKDQNIPQAL